METRVNILNELNELSPLVASIGNANPYQVPAGYFETLPSQLMDALKVEATSFGDKSTVYAVPEGYFDSLAINVLNKVKQQDPSVYDELEELAPVLNTISKKPVYTVPEGYFESLELTIPLKLDRPSARVFSFGKARRMLQYGVAAVTAGILMFGAYMYSYQNGPEISYREAATMDLNQELAEVKTEDINNYLNETPVLGYAVNTGQEDIDLEQIIEVTSDQEITDYLEETSEPGEKIKDS